MEFSVNLISTGQFDLLTFLTNYIFSIKCSHSFETRNVPPIEIKFISSKGKLVNKLPKAAKKHYFDTVSLEKTCRVIKTKKFFLYIYLSTINCHLTLSTGAVNHQQGSEYPNKAQRIISQSCKIWPRRTLKYQSVLFPQIPPISSGASSI